MDILTTLLCILLACATFLISLARGGCSLTPAATTRAAGKPGPLERRLGRLGLVKAVVDSKVVGTIQQLDLNFPVSPRVMLPTRVRPYVRHLGHVSVSSGPRLGNLGLLGYACGQWVVWVAEVAEARLCK
ncbi:hypothetical protein OOU_Y34scaffold00207g55 [Pyricularia oryzae Y34]|uniref:Uncharacterized protein n=1 Tax=Pyricularia oryzae (strain Y34) TaxID=1143189 RepID=A0AA97P5S8_PYRO3|nr:hypothetical protein OOU_Y34scaffold00207g55 [Pyricularia oryzae Y34]